MQLSGLFLIFLAVFLPLYFVVPDRIQSGLLFVGSVVFYAFAGWRALIVLGILTAVTYTVGRGIGGMLERRNVTLQAHRTDGSWDKPMRKRYRNAQARRVHLLLFFGVSFDAFLLLAFKSGLPVRMGAFQWAMPMGLSFVTLGAIGYLFDVAHEQIVCEKHFARFALFMCYFPQLWQGPINRYGELAPQLSEMHTWNARRTAEGALRILWGYMKKLLFADTAAVATAAILEAQHELGGAGMLVLLPLYSLQIYADFTGGMDISLGVSHILGIQLYENFDAPFASPSLGEYWRRWHRSLGRFFTDHVFYPLSVSRPVLWLSRHARRVFGEAVGRRVPLYIAMLCTWLLTGLWHGVSWNFILWGLFNGVFLLLSRELRPLRVHMGQRVPRLAASRPWQSVLCVGTFLVAGLFRTLDLNPCAQVALSLWGKMFTPDAAAALSDGSFWAALGLGGAQWVLLGGGVILMWWVGRKTPRLHDADSPTLRARIAARPWLCTVLCALAVCAVVIFGRYGMGYDASAFIYGRF